MTIILISPGFRGQNFRRKPPAYKGFRAFAGPTIKYDEVYLKAYESVSHAKASLGQFITFYNSRRPHQAFAGKTPDMIYFAGLPQEKLVA